MDKCDDTEKLSYIIAKRKDCRINTIYKALKPAKENLLSYLKQEYEYIDEIPKELYDAIVNGDDEKTTELALQYLAKQIYDSDFGQAAVEIDDWKISAGECDPESGKLLDNFLYYYGYMIKSNDYFKIG